MGVQNQHRHAAKLQRQWAASAMRDARYNAQRAVIERRAGNRVLSGMYHKEAGVDVYWGRRRLVDARKESGRG
jgi:hypothetical protein